MSESLKKKTAKGFFWSGIDRLSSQGIQFVFSLLIARLLMPSDYGVVAMLGIFIAISQVFIDSGFATALVQKVDRTETDCSTVFYFNIVASVIAYIALWIASPWIAGFYNTPLLEPVTKVVALNLIFGAFSGVQNAKMTIALDFKTGAKISVAVTVLTGIVGLLLAYNGWGVWALVFQSLFSVILRTVLLWCLVRWRPRWVFSWKSFKRMFSFGSRLMASSLLDIVYNNVYVLVIGKRFSSSTLGYYSQAESLVVLPSSGITNVLQRVTFPVLCSIQNEAERMASIYRRFLSMAAFIVFPLMIGLSAVADPFIRLVLTDKWAGTIYLLQILCFSLMWYPIHAINLNILQVKGHSDYFLKLEIIKKAFGACVLCVTIPMGLVAMCYGRVFSSVLMLAVNTYYTRKLLGYGFFSQLRDLLHILIHALVMGVLVWGVIQIVPGNGLKLLVGISVGVAYYLLGAWLMRFQELEEVVSMVRRK